MENQNTPLSIDIEYYIVEINKFNGIRKKISKNFNTKTVHYKDNIVSGINFGKYKYLKHDIEKTREEVCRLAISVYNIYNENIDLEIVSEYWDSAGYGTGWREVIWKNGFFIK